ncbi:MAG: FixH family protein [Pseudomonadota bacterium]
MITNNTTSHPSWKKEPLVWMIIAIPFSAVIMGVFMITLAIQSDSGLVIDDYYKHGKEINRVLARDKAAFELGLSADLEIDRKGLIKITLSASQPVQLEQPLEFKMIHATRPGLDQFFKIKTDQMTLQVPAYTSITQGKWNLILQNQAWRITGSIQRPEQQNVLLLPSHQ